MHILLPRTNARGKDQTLFTVLLLWQFVRAEVRTVYYRLQYLGQDEKLQPNRVSMFIVTVLSIFCSSLAILKQGLLSLFRYWLSIHRTYEVDAQSKLTWANQSFIKSFRTMQELSGFPSLNVIYKIRMSLAITSSSAMRAMSRVWLIKKRLRTTMLDDWFSSMVIPASEKDILANFTILLNSRPVCYPVQTVAKTIITLNSEYIWMW